MIFNLKTRPDRIGTEILSILFQFYYCYKYNYILRYNTNNIRFKDSIFMASIINLINEHNNKIINNSSKQNMVVNDTINIPGPGESDMCYGMGKIVQETHCDMLTFFKKHFYEKIKEFYNLNTSKYIIPFDIENSIVIHLRLDDQWWESDYDGKVCSSHYSNLINNDQNCFFTNGPNNQYNKQNPLSSHKIKQQLDILLREFPNSKVIIISSPLTKIPELDFNYDMIIQNNDYNHDLFLLSKSKKIILSRSNFALISLFFGEQTHIHMPLWGHFACAGFNTKYDNCKFNYFY
jgi:hypothetical protein